VIHSRKGKYIVHVTWPNGLRKRDWRPSEEKAKELDLQICGNGKALREAQSSRGGPRGLSHAGDRPEGRDFGTKFGTRRPKRRLRVSRSG